MFFCLPESAQEEVQRTQALLDEHNPWPAQDLRRLSLLAADTPDGEKRFADFRLFVLDIDSLIQESRWAVGNALLILRAFPQIVQPLSDVEDKFQRIGTPARVHLLISDYILGRERVFFQDLLERRPGGKRVGAWMIQILADHVVASSIGVLDRLSHLLILAADVKAPRDRMYFRSGKLEQISLSKPGIVTESLLEIARSEELNFLLRYRDGLAHTTRTNVSALGSAAIDNYLDQDGQTQRIVAEAYSCEDLIGIGLMAFELSRQALDEVVDRCEIFLADSKRSDVQLDKREEGSAG